MPKAQETVQAIWTAMPGWLRIAAIALVYVLVMAVAITAQQGAIIPKFSSQSAFVIFLDAVIDWSVWLLLTPGIIWLARKLPMFRRGRPRWTVLVHLVLGTAATAIWSLPIALITVIFAWYGFDEMKPMPYSSAYMYELQGRSFYYSLFYWLVVGVVTARQLARDAQEEAAEAAKLESEALAADFQAARVHYDPRGLARELREAAEMAEADPVRAEEHILETAQELHRSLVLTSQLAPDRPRRTAAG
jgi:hypothetical protein